MIARFVEQISTSEPAFLPLHGRCYERETVPYKAMDAVIDELSRHWSQLPDGEAAELLAEHAAHLPKLFPVLGRVPALMQIPAVPAVPDPQEMRTRAFAALRGLFLKLASKRPVVLVLDDLQWIDDDSVTLLTDIMRPPDPPAILLLLASRDETDRSRRAGTDADHDRGRSEVPALGRLLAALPRHELIEVGPLSPEDARRLASGMLVDSRRELIDTVVSEAAGSPFFLAELSRYLQESP